MPPSSRISSKRTIEDVVNFDDIEEDKDYDDKRQRGPPRHRSTRGRGPIKPSGKRARGGYSGSDIEDDEDSLASDDDLSIDDDEEEIETNERGRPVRKTARRAATYQDPSSEESDEDDLAQSPSESEKTVTPRKPRRKLVVKLKIGSTPLPASTRTLRTRGGSFSTTARATSSNQVTGATRRSRRLSHDEEESVVALTNSGRHVEVVRAGSRDPDDIPMRAYKGGKGIKYPSKSTIDEEDEFSQLKPDEEEPEIKASQHEIQESDHQTQAEPDDELPQIISDFHTAASQIDEHVPLETSDPLQHADGGNEGAPAEDEDEDEDEEPVTRGRSLRSNLKRKAGSPPADVQDEKRLRSGRRTNPSRSTRKKPSDESSDFDPEAGGGVGDQESMSGSSESEASPHKNSRQNDDYDSSNAERRSTRTRRKATSHQSPVSHEEDELLAEVAELQKDKKRSRPSRDEITFEPRGTRRAVKKPNYDLLRNLAPIDDEDEVAAPSPSQRARKPGAGSWQRSLLSTYGPFGGAGGLPPVLGGPSGLRAQGDVDSDSSDDDILRQPKQVGGTVGMTPTTAGGFNLFTPVQPLNSDAIQAGLGKIKDKQALADADPLGVDQNVNFDSVGGLQGHIDQLKEMVSLPLLYPEIFLRFKITPPRGVLFHGPPGTGKTLLARALASSVSSQGKKVTFYMRKGADALSKWVGEAERQLRLLFEEARKNQPSIIFFDEIDGLAPVRSSKQEQIHASIVSTLLALMDGMDGRGQVIVIGATNRPDSIDPALRRPGRFDREFYFPLPNKDGRRAILDIHTRGWDPPLEPSIKDELAELTKGYGGADLRALCVEAALNAVQRRYPQIYGSNEKLIIDPKTIEVTPKDFMISVKKMVPSSERSASSGASPLPISIEPLLRNPVAQIKALLAEILPQKKKTTALEEAQYEDVADGQGFGRERMQQAFESSRVFRPRLLVQGKFGMGQQYVAAALLAHFEGVHVQSFDLATLLSDNTASPEATVIRLFSEVKMHKPSVIYIPNVQEWYLVVGQTVISTFLGLLRSIKPSDPILVLGVLEHEHGEIDEAMRQQIFGYSKKNQFQLREPGHSERHEFFIPVRDYLRTAPSDFPDPTDRKKRVLEELPVAPPEPEKAPPPLSKDELKAQKKKDRQTLNMLKIRLQPIMDQIRTRHKKFRTPVIDEAQIRYLCDEADPGTVSSDLPTDLRARASFRPFEIGKDAHGVPGLIDQSNDKFYYNLDSVTIEKRLSNGYYKRPKDFLADIKRLAKDAKAIGDEDRLLKANELLANVEVDIGGIEVSEPVLTAECEKVYQRELAREKEMVEKAKADAAAENMPPPQVFSNVPFGTSNPSTNTMPSEGPITLGIPVQKGRDIFSRVAPVTPSRPQSHTSIMTNGVHSNHDDSHETHLTNGSTSHNGGNEADIDMDLNMGNTDPHSRSNERSNATQGTHTMSSFGNRESAQPRPFHSYTAPSQQLRKEQGMSAPLSQTGPITPMVYGSQAADYQNDASTTQTTSGKKHSGPSSGEKEQNGNTQDLGPNLYLYDERRSAGGSQIPDTQQDPHSQSSGFNSNHSQSQLREGNGNSRLSQPPVPLFGNRNGDTGPPRSYNSASQPYPSTHYYDSEHQQRPQTTLPPTEPLSTTAADNFNNRRRPSHPLSELLNPAEPAKQQHPNLVQIPSSELHNFHSELATQTSGLSVEQLEQVNSVLMDTLWHSRGEWDRTRVLVTITTAFNEVLHDMSEVGQDLGRGSWERSGAIGTQDSAP